MPENEEKDGGKGFAKTDMERIGIFKELGYITIGDKYTTSDNAFNQSASKGRQIQVTGPKQKSGLQAGYFNEKFTRVMEGEAYSDQVKIRAQYRMNESKKNLGGRFVPTNGEKKMSGVGSYYESFSVPIEALSPVVSQAKAHEPPKKNLYTNPGKKGTGYGYAGVTFSRYNDYASENYDQFREIVKQETEAHKKAMRGNAFRLSTAPREYFDENPYKSDKPESPARSKSAPQSSTKVKPFKPTSPAKRDGGMKAGTFEAYPSHSSEPYKVRKTDKKEAQANQKAINKVFVPPAGIKSTPVNSVLNQNVNRSVNIQNYRTVQAVMSY